MKRCFAALIALLLAAGAARAADASPTEAAGDKTARKAGTAFASLVGRRLHLFGRTGELVLANGKGKALDIVKLTLPGEVISDPSQKCEITIVGEAPIEAKPQGDPDGPPRYVADIPACPFAFDALSESVLAPQQTTACVFAAADCQANPSGLWGPDVFTLAAETTALAEARQRAEKSIVAHVNALIARKATTQSDISKEMGDFAASREQVCRDYEDESTSDFCHTELTEARELLLRHRLAEARKASAKKTPENKKEKTDDGAAAN